MAFRAILPSGAKATIMNGAAMPITHYVRPDGILVVERSGGINTSDEDVALQERIKDVQVVPGMGVLVDSRGVVEGDSIEVVQHTAAIGRATAAELDCGAIAHVVKSDVEYGMARMYMALTDVCHPNTEVFGCFDEALSWVRSQTAGPGPPDHPSSAPKGE
ncbi:MAG: hypothetical protein ABIH26_04630 [Candidatus Eisenbacteria bacterium]